MYVMEKNCKCAIHFEGVCAKFPFKTLQEIQFDNKKSCLNTQA